MDLYLDEYNDLKKYSEILFDRDIKRLKTVKNNRKLEPLPNLENLPTIPQFFENLNVFITGGTGFMGKVLIEKILRSCPGVNKIYLLLRPKKGCNEQTRINEMFKIPLYDCLRKENPDAMSKVQIISGNCEQPNLGLSEESMNLLIENIHVVYHVAASVRFDDPLKKAVLMNVRATRDVVELCKKIRNLKVLVHVSTSYCNTDKQIIDEIVYPYQADWRKIIQMAETFDEDKIRILQPKILDHFPNTYTFTKSLAENLVNDECENIPTVIFRPSIVVGTMNDPFPGWIDNLNGPAGLLVGVGSGVLHNLYCDGNIVPDYVPVDKAISSIIIASWYQAHNTKAKKQQTLVINACTSNIIAVSNNTILELLMTMNKIYPFNRRIWYPFLFYTKNTITFHFCFIFFHLIPGIFLELLLRLTGNDLQLMKIYRKIYIANNALKFFMINQWAFKNGHFVSLNDIMVDSDKKEFNIDIYNIHAIDTLKTGIFGFKTHLLKEPTNFHDTLPKARKLLSRFYIAHCIVGFLYGLAFFFVLLYIIPSFSTKRLNGFL